LKDSRVGDTNLKILMGNVDPAYRNFVNPDIVVCSVCNQAVKAKFLAYHIEEYHFERDRPWNEKKRKRMRLDQSRRRAAL
jgi:hypothetical protein